MRQLLSFPGLAGGILAALAGCSDGQGGAGAGVIDAAGPDGRDGREGDGPATTDGGLGARLSWYCPAAGATCPPDEITSYNRCLFDKCESSLRLCPCEAWIDCTTRCECNDLACRAACIPTFDCLACGQSVAQCVQASGCGRPACFEAPDASPPDTIRPPVIPPVVVVPAPAVDARPDVPGSDAGGPDPGSGTDGGLQGTCADLRRCCESLASATARATCLSQVMVLQTDPLCAAALLVYRGNGMCQ